MLTVLYTNYSVVILNSPKSYLLKFVYSRQTSNEQFNCYFDLTCVIKAKNLFWCSKTILLFAFLFGNRDAIGSFFTRTAQSCTHVCAHIFRRLTASSVAIRGRQIPNGYKKKIYPLLVFFFLFRLISEMSYFCVEIFVDEALPE